MTYKTFDELNGKTLKRGDKVYFFGVIYTVCEEFLSIESSNNREALDTIVGNNVKAYVKKAYGYISKVGNWPQSKTRDYEALTRLCLVMLADIEGLGTIVMAVNRKKVEFECSTTIIKSRKLQVGQDYRAYVLEEGIKVGCQLISYDQLKAIYELAKEFKYV
jgi:hypothetical protein